MNFRSPRTLQKIFIILLVLGLVTFGVITFIEKRKEKKLEEARGLDVSYVDDVPSELTQDTDGDGVPDWEEILWGLDPESTDSDGDGVSDATYLKNKKNIQERRALGLENVETTLTESEKLGRSVLTALLAVDTDGGLSAQTETQISNNIVDYVSSLAIGGTLYVRENLNLVPNTKENSYAYRDQLRKLFQEYPVNQNDLTLIIQSLENSTAYKGEVSVLAERYDILLNELILLPVPYAIGGRHTELVNSIAYLTGSLKNLSQDEVDDLVSLSTLVQMQEVVANVQEADKYIEKYFEIIEEEGIFREEY